MAVRMMPSVGTQQGEVWRDKRFALLCLILLAIGILFWTGSRYPALQEKAIMGAQTNIFGIGFDPLITITSETPAPQKALYTFLNWLHTNWKGMTFGILFGSVLMTLFGLLRHRTFKSRFANSFMGMVMGAPLGVCVNCATPIAQGLHSSGRRVETSLGALFSSPTLNFIVITMLFSFFPLYVGVVKLSLTIIFILFIMPLIVRLAGVKDVTTDLARVPTSSHTLPDLTSSDDNVPVTWVSSVLWCLQALAKSLWFLIRQAVPLMLLAGGLGAIAITFLPLDVLANMLPTSPLVWAALSLVAVAILGAFLPVPMSFDVIVVLVLLESGLHTAYAATLLFTLGLFSVYPLLIIARDMSRRLAFGLFFSVVALGVVSGVGTDWLDDYHTAQNTKFIYKSLKDAAPPPPLPIQDLPAVSGEMLSAQLAEGARVFSTGVSVGEGLELSQLSFEPSTAPTAATLFHETLGEQWGFNEPLELSVRHLFITQAEHFRGIASGDMHNDGWQDIIVASHNGFSLYANRQGKEFVRQQVALPKIKEPFTAITVALVDLNNDNWLDIFFSTRFQGSYIAYNNAGSFDNATHYKLPNVHENAMVVAPAFGDIDTDGDLDIVLGNWSVASLKGKYTMSSSENAWLENSGEEFLLRKIPGVGAETLTTALHDFSGDGHLDLFVGNDFFLPDTLYLGDGKGNWRQVTKEDGIFPYTTVNTMSYAAADIDNNLQQEIYIGQIAREGVGEETPSEALCSIYSNKNEKSNCENAYTSVLSFSAASQGNNSPKVCTSLRQTGLHSSCIATHVLRNLDNESASSICDVFGTGWDSFAIPCKLIFQDGQKLFDAENSSEIPSIGQTNQLFIKTDEGYSERAKDFEVDKPGWTWNARFADVNNDTWQDLYMAIGWIGGSRSYTGNILYINEQGRKFDNQTLENGFLSKLPTGAYTYIDFDNDGDLDIISLPFLGPVTVYVNQGNANNAVAFSLHDEQGNSRGVGARVVVTYGDGLQQMREVVASGGYQSFDAPVVHFGLGGYDKIKSAEIHWYDGEVDYLNALEANTHYLIRRKADRWLGAMTNTK